MHSSLSCTVNWPSHVLGDVSPVVLGVDPPVHLQVVTRSHLEPAHAPRVPSEVGHVIEAALIMKREMRMRSWWHLTWYATTILPLAHISASSIRLKILVSSWKQNITNQIKWKFVSPFHPLCWLWQPLRKLRPHRGAADMSWHVVDGCWIFLGYFCFD